MSDPPDSDAEGDGPAPTIEWQPRLSEAADGRYELVEEIGVGGMATVFRARDHRLGRTVAVKILHRHLISDPEHCARFRREAESIARLDHPGVVSIYDLLEISGEFLAIIMEYVDGRGLDDVLDAAPPLPPELAAALAIELLDALEHAHDHGVVHRDLKPANILVDGTSLRLTDFGIAHVVDKSTLTHTGSVLGSPHFMSPEMAEGEPVDHRTDLFSLGSLLYLMVTARRPFEAKSTPGVLRNIAEGRHRRADYERESVGRDFASILEEFLSIDADDRPADAECARQILDAFVTDGLSERPDPAAWLDDPDGYTSTLNVRIEDSLRRLARSAVDEGQRRRALSLVERLLAIAPGDDEAEQLLDDLHDDRGPARKLTAKNLVGVVVAALVGGIAVYSTLEVDDPDRPATSSAFPPEAGGDDEYAVAVPEDAETVMIAAASDVALHTVGTARHAAETIPADDSRTAGAADDAPSETPVIAGEDFSEVPVPESAVPASEISDDDISDAVSRVRFQLVPASATIAIDGDEHDAMQASRGIELPRGTHDITASGPATETYRRTIDVGPDDGELRSVVLSWKDGYIRLQVDRDALVWLDGEQTPRRVDGGEAKTIPISFGRANEVASERDVDLRIAARDDLQIVRKKTVRVRPDTETPVAVTLHEN